MGISLGLSAAHSFDSRFEATLTGSPNQLAQDDRIMGCPGRKRRFRGSCAKLQFAEAPLA